MPPRKHTPCTDEIKTAQADAILRGEDAKKTLADAYLIGLFERMESAYRNEILSLHPTNTQKFTALQERRQGLIDLRGSIVSDVEQGKKALAQAQGEQLKSRVA